VLDRNFSSRTMSFRTLGRSPAAVVEAGVVTETVMGVEVFSVRRPDYLAPGCRSHIDWAVAVGFLYQRNS